MPDQQKSHMRFGKRTTSEVVGVVVGVGGDDVGGEAGGVGWVVVEGDGGLGDGGVGGECGFYFGWFDAVSADFDLGVGAAEEVELALCFHYAVLDAQDDLATAIARLRELTQSGDYAYYVEIAHFMAGLPLTEHIAPARWLDGERQTRERWRNLVETRRNRLGAAR
ncbi:hypothetical protein ACQUSN_21260 [Streptomyces pseudogriseolus]|uniref:hypothetical protein n=1 Tax=Streptomyces pseudogriseolus TaxID=36817 RepID=UPI003FA27DDB